jgi:hypothetical protein
MACKRGADISSKAVHRLTPPPGTNFAIMNCHGEAEASDLSDLSADGSAAGELSLVELWTVPRGSVCGELELDLI